MTEVRNFHRRLGLNNVSKNISAGPKQQIKVSKELKNGFLFYNIIYPSSLGLLARFSYEGRVYQVFILFFFLFWIVIFNLFLSFFSRLCFLYKGICT